jgi:ubiquinone/menaquinone biosynthesis C-methylase UbiE
MKRLNQQNLNKPDLDVKEFHERWRGQFHYIDWARFYGMAKYFKGGKFLDIGVFNSPLIVELKRRFPSSEFVGLDHCEQVMKELQEKYSEVTYMAGDAMNLPFEDNTFDYVVAGEIIEHIEDPTTFIKEAMRVLKPGGVFSLSTPKEEGITQGLVSLEHLWSFDEQDIKNLLEPYGRVELSTMRISQTEQFIAICFLN